MAQTDKRTKRNYPIDIVELTVSFNGTVFYCGDFVDDSTDYEMMQELPETIRHLLVHGLKQKLCDGHASLKAEVNMDNEGKPLPKDEWRELTDDEILQSMKEIFNSLKEGWGVRVASIRNQTVRMLENAGIVITAGMTPEQLAEAMIEAAKKLKDNNS